GGEVRQISLNDEGSNGFEGGDVNERAEGDMTRGEGADLSEHPWPMFQHDARHTGYNPNAVYDNPGRLKWKVKVGDWTSDSSPVLLNNGTVLMGVYKGATGLVAVRSGRILWRYSTSPVCSTPLVDENGIIFFGSMYESEHLYALYPNGTLKWKFKVEDSITSSPVKDVEEDVIYFGCVNNYLYAVYSNGTLKWKFKTGYMIFGSPAIGSDGTIYFASADTYLYAAYPNGTLKWKFGTGGWISEAPVVDSNGTIYVSSQENIYAVYPNGTLKWKYSLNGAGPPNGLALGKNGEIYFATRDYFYALYPNGTLKWRIKTSALFYGSPVTGGNGIIYFCGGYRLFAVYPNGTIKWSVGFKGVTIYSQPSIDNNGNVYLGDLAGYLYCIGALEPSEPVGVSAVSGDGYVEVFWGEPEDDGGAEIEGYRVYRREIGESGDGENFTLLADVGPDVFRYRDEDVVNGWRYEYYVVAYNREGEGNRSEIVIGEPKGRPGAPRGLNATVGKWYVFLWWYEPDNDGGSPITEYRLYRKGLSENRWRLIATAGGRSYNDTTVYSGGTYDYRVSAVNVYGEGECSEVLRVKVAVPPDPPVNVWGEAGDGYAHIYWSEPAEDGGDEVVGYRLYRDGELLVEVEGREYNDTEVENGVEYVYQVSALNGKGEGLKSVGLRLRPMGLLGMPRNFTFELEVGEGRVVVVLSWGEPEDDGGGEIEAYRVYRGNSLLGEVEGREYRDENVSLGEEYRYRVSAVNEVGEGGYTEVELEIPDYPGVPGNVSVEVVDGGIVVRWEEPREDGGLEILGYYVYRDDGGGWVRVGEVENRTYFDGDVEEGREYRYCVSAYNELGEGDKSDEVKVKIEITDSSESEDGDGGGGEFTTLLLAAAVVVIVGAVTYIYMRRRRGAGGEQDSEG
ncbi:MAG: PQQ-binding-like beta-propeller repeat protein, partial [Thermoplasmata archaeon]|nr:PQQ-binding-like beta-propeller repeat protein [Thermoplasmata archaeon]